MKDPLVHENILQDIGLTKNETKIYLSLLKKRKATATEIAEESRVHRVNVYDSIKKLKIHGLVTELLIDGKKVFSATDPKNVMNIVKEKEVKLNTILPELEMLHSFNKKSCDVDIYETKNAIRKQFLRFVDKGEPIYYWGIPKEFLGIIGKKFQEEIHKRRAKKKQWMYHIYNSDAKDRSDYLNTIPYTKSRLLSSEYDSPIATAISGDELILNLLTKENKLISVSIQNKLMAEAYEKYFWIIWEKAKK